MSSKAEDPAKSLYGPCLPQWGENSYFLEVKPRTDFATLFIDCPEGEELLQEQQDPETSSNLSAVVRVGEHGICVQYSDRERPLFVHLERVTIKPESLSTPAWADHSRLFMCKAKADIEGRQLVAKSYSRLAKEMCSLGDLQNFAESATGSSVKLQCSCGNVFAQGDKGSLEIGHMPSDDWLNTSPGIDFFCRDTCGAACHPTSHSCNKDLSLASPHDEWLPKTNKMVISFAYTHVSNDTIIENRIGIDGRKLTCKACRQEIGITNRTRPHIFQLHHAVTKLSIAARSYLDTNFSTVPSFFASCILSKCEAEGSQKIMIRSLDRTPYVLLWLLDTFVVFAGGHLSTETAITAKENAKLQRTPSNTSTNSSGSKNSQKKGRKGKRRTSSTSSVSSQASDDGAIGQIVDNPFPALKMLYKVFDQNSASSDPRATGEDSSVSVVDLPAPFAIRILEAILRSTCCLPPACRSVGQFYVGFLPLEERIM
ncbi:unnamed protein product, partial [Mesorhabditis belari]|uniref:E3 ubiquitin-protein ligase E3D n=1 Tax=Mesorhabditis belari TaxID=2138241 RepID=A0AAF3J1X9_9BILA